ncbi:hypothetical protein I5907_13690 [Panacibacter sp. DH6]|uniref:Beta-lactamase-inhibitor-like PepSY-like domain-containing protein n=1 Tax=Panacibacter microcysteis TaxID=2793269 RepID=A0A931EAK1_9BACT|nr:hypothetical protein [Panacibacter microcysteis]MBG9377289.1 hypothetical protein [Panacibacter microcysteis]
MKKRSIGLAVVLLIGASAFYEPLKQTIQEKPVEQNISLSIYKGANYNAKVYDCTYAQVQVFIQKVNGNNRTIVWQKTFDEQLLKQYPSVENAIREEVRISGIKERKEHLEVVYVLVYNSKGAELQMQGGSVIEKNITATASPDTLSLVL